MSRASTAIYGSPQALPTVYTSACLLGTLDLTGTTWTGLNLQAALTTGTLPSSGTVIRMYYGFSSTLYVAIADVTAAVVPTGYIDMIIQKAASVQVFHNTPPLTVDGTYLYCWFNVTNTINTGHTVLVSGVQILAGSGSGGSVDVYGSSQSIPGTAAVACLPAKKDLSSSNWNSTDLQISFTSGAVPSAGKSVKLYYGFSDTSISDLTTISTAVPVSGSQVIIIPTATNTTVVYTTAKSQILGDFLYCWFSVLDTINTDNTATVLALQATLC